MLLAQCYKHLSAVSIGSIADYEWVSDQGNPYGLQVVLKRSIPS